MDVASEEAMRACMLGQVYTVGGGDAMLSITGNFLARRTLTDSHTNLFLVALTRIEFILQVVTLKMYTTRKRTRRIGAEKCKAGRNEDVICRTR